MNRSLKIEIVVDSNGAVRGIRNLGGSLDTAGDSVKRFSSAAEKGIGIVAATVVLRFAQQVGQMARRVVGDLFEMGTSVEETGSKFKTTFGEASESVDRFLDDFAHMAGLTTTEGREIAATLGAMARGMGLSTESAGDLSTRVIQLAGDMASFNNTSIEETLTAVRAGLIGEAEPLRRYGILLTAATVEQRALADTGKTNAKQLTEQDKVLARLALAYEQAGVQVGDLERTQDSTANKARRLNAQFREQAQIFAQSLLPAFGLGLDQVEAFSGGIEEALGSVSKFLAQGIFEAVAQLTEFGFTVYETIASLDGLLQAINVVSDDLSPQGPLVTWLEDLMEDWQAFNAIIAAGAVALLEFRAAGARVGASLSEALGMDERAEEARNTADAFKFEADQIREGLRAGRAARRERKANIESRRAELRAILERLEAERNAKKEDTEDTETETGAVKDPIIQRLEARGLADNRYTDLATKNYEERLKQQIAAARVEREMTSMYTGQLDKRTEATIKAGEKFREEEAKRSKALEDEEKANRQALTTAITSNISQVQSFQDAGEATINVIKQKVLAFMAETIASSLASLGPLALILGPPIAFGIKALFSSLIPGFQFGGRPRPGAPALVGEAGPELFIPDRPGFIVPNNVLSQPLGQASTGASRQTVEITGTGHIRGNDIVIVYDRAKRDRRDTLGG